MGRLDCVGIEKIRIYPTQLKLELAKLAKQRNYSVEHMQQELMVHERGLNPLWEDSVTMAVNAAKPMLSEEDRESIGLLIVGTETGLDQEKSLSSWVHRFLSLPSSCRHFEIKGACYSGTASLKMATAWLMSIAHPGQKALVITSDQSLNAMNQPWEYIGGAGAVALLVSHQPDFAIIENEKFGIYSQEVSDVIRPHPWLETGNSEDSLFSYMEGLNNAYEDYIKNTGEIFFRDHFDYNIYHVPFAGISYRAHKQLLQYDGFCQKKEVQESYNQKTLPSIYYPQRIGATYGGSVFIALFSLVQHAKNLQKSDRVGIFSYGSGSCAELYSCTIGDKAKEITSSVDLTKMLEERFSVSVEEYEKLENTRIQMSLDPNFQPDFDFLKEALERQYLNQDTLIYRGSKSYYRNYEFV